MQNIGDFGQLKDFVSGDLFRYIGTSPSLKNFILAYIRIPGFRYSFWLRSAVYFNRKFYLLGLYARFRLRHYSFKYGIQIPYSTQIDKGFYIGHFGNIVISPEAVIGKNVNISQGVTIGRVAEGAKKGAPIISNNVYIAPGAKIFGGIRIGANVAIGANAVVNKDVADNSVVVGVPAKLVSENGSFKYIHNTI